MKLTKLHLFLIIMVVLLLSTLGFSIKEYFDGSHTHSSEDIKGGSVGHTHKITIGQSEIVKGDSNDAMDDAKKNRADPNPDPALEEGSNYDPFQNSGTHDPLLDNDYSKTIAGLEDIVVPGRGRRHHHDENGDHLPGAHEERREERREERKMKKKLEKEERKLAEEAGVDMSKYILKSEIVPPVCPKCPDSRTCPRQKPAPPCPPCARCPEPAFECKKVPNYSAIDAANAGNILPMPRLNSFAQFN